MMGKEGRGDLRSHEKIMLRDHFLLANCSKPRV